MKKSLLLVAALFLLVGCSSKKDICARAAGSQISTEEAVQKLGLKSDTDGDTWGNTASSTKTDEELDNYGCAYPPQ